MRACGSYRQVNATVVDKECSINYLVRFNHKLLPIIVFYLPPQLLSTPASRP